MTIHSAIAVSPSPRLPSGSPHARPVPVQPEGLRGEGRGEGQRHTPEQAAAPHPNPLPAEKRGEGMRMIPETAPFSMEQRAWLNGFFAGVLSLDAQVSPLDGELPGAVAKVL